MPPVFVGDDRWGPGGSDGTAGGGLVVAVVDLEGVQSRIRFRRRASVRQLEGSSVGR